MQTRWMMAPWMRRRIARYIERGTSERIIACLVAPSGSPTLQDGPERPAWPGGHVDLSNVILFRALGGRVARPESRAH